MSKNQQRPHVGPAVGLIAGISSATQTQNGRFLLSFLPPRMGPMGIMRIMGLIFPMVGVTGLEPVTLRLSSACSNQLSYRPYNSRRPKSCASTGDKGIRTPDL